MENRSHPPKPMPAKGEPVKLTRRKKLFSSSDLRASSIGWEIAIPIFSGPLVGFFIDRRFDTDVRWTMILMGTGLLSAVVSVIKYINHELYKMNQELEAKKAELEKLTKGSKRVTHLDEDTP